MSDTELQGTALKKEISRYAVRLANRVGKKNTDELKLSLAIGFLNQAQMIAEVDPTRSKRLLAKVKSIA